MGFDELFAYIDAQVSILSSIIQYVFDALLAYIAAEDSAMRQNFLGLGNWLTNIWGKLHAVFDAIWTNYLRGWIKRIEGIIQAIMNVLAFYAYWIQKFINFILKIWNTYFYPYLKAILEVIQRTRVVLELFRLLGFQWAAKLDADLQKLQGYITTVVHDVIGTLNGITDILDLTVDPLGILRADFFRNTLTSSVFGVKRLSTAGADRASTPAEAKQAQDYQDAVDGKVPLAVYNLDGSTALSPVATDVQAGIDAEMKAEGMPVYAH